MVLTETDEIDSELIGEHGFGDDITNDLRVMQRLAPSADGDVAEGVETKLKMRCDARLSGHVVVLRVRTGLRSIRVRTLKLAVTRVRPSRAYHRWRSERSAFFSPPSEAALGQGASFQRVRTV